MKKHQIQSLDPVVSLKAFALLCFLHIAHFTQAQISGTITDAELGEALIGVNVTIKDSPALGTITDYNGQYTIEASDGDYLVVSFIGYRTQEILVGSGANYNISMEEASEVLDEVVVVGYGAVEKQDLTGVIQRVGEKDFIEGSLASPERLLNGKVAGLQIMGDGEPGGKNILRLRGGTSLDASSKPLIVIDGVPMDNRELKSGRNPFNFVNAADVESISILKDASASAIYGSRGANGVIIITTKSGSKGKMKLHYNGNVNTSILNGSPNNLSPANFRAAISAKAPQEIEYLGDESTDWVKEITQNAQSTEHNISLSGGTDKYDYYVSGGYIKSNGVIKTSSHQNKSIGLNFNTKFLNDALKVSIKSKTGFSDDRFTPGVIGAALAFDPTRPVLDADSEFGGFFQWDDPLAVNNPVSSLELTDHTGQSTRSLNNLMLTYDLPMIQGLSITSNTSYDKINGSKREHKDPLLKDGESFVRGGFLFNEELENYTTLIETYGTYKTKLGENTKFELTAGHSWQDFDQQNRWNSGFGLIDSIGETFYTTDEVQDSFLVHNRLISFFGRTNFTFNEKYLLTASLRRDGSSRFGATNKWGLFPAVAVGWRILEEDFAAGLNNVFTDLKLRVSWGVTGNEDITDFLFKTFYSYGAGDSSYQFGDDYVNTLRGTGVDPDIKWEETTSLNLGLDYGFFNNRISGSIELYRKNTDDLLFTVAVPGFTNLKDRILTNIGELENKGLEFTINTVPMDRKDWDWDVGFNVAYNKNKITKLDNSDGSEFEGYETGEIDGDVGQTIQILKVGEGIQTFRTYTHIMGADGKPLTDDQDWNGDGFTNSLDIYEDLNMDGLINEADLSIKETATPDLIFGLTSNLRYKKFDLSTTIRANTGNYVYNNVASSSGYFEKLTDRRTNNIDESAFVYGFNKRQLKSDIYIEDASFLKIDNVTLGFSPGSSKMFSSLRFYFTVNNLMTFTGYSGLDPELAQFNNGIDNGPFPLARNFLFGLSADF